ncbi:hypothetical protein [Streptomyces olivaceoviridis]|uniref:hypothetical protein n=1 Tax=Streptomyces olivaceoviridis TaxID=1921 RepID=UPI0036A379A2
MTTMHTLDGQTINQVRTVESPLIAELVAAMRHLEHAAQAAGTPADEASHYSGRITTEQLGQWVLGNADRIRRALDRITAPYKPTA